MCAPSALDMDRANPCFVAFKDDRRFPSKDFGPVLRLALARLAAMRLSLIGRKEPREVAAFAIEAVKGQLGLRDGAVPFDGVQIFRIPQRS